MSPDKKQQFNIYLPPELIRETKHASVDTGGSLSDFVAEALTAYLHNSQNDVEAIRPRQKNDLSMMTIVYVRDVARSLSFYQALGFQLAVQERTGGWVELHKGEAILALHESDQPSQRQENDVELAFISHKPLEALLESLEQAGFPVARPIIDESYGRSVTLESPDGLLIQVNEHEIDLYI